MRYVNVVWDFVQKEKSQSAKLQIINSSQVTCFVGCFHPDNKGVPMAQSLKQQDCNPPGYRFKSSPFLCS